MRRATKALLDGLAKLFKARSSIGLSVKMMMLMLMLMLQPSWDVPCSSKLKCHSAASEAAWAGAAKTSLSQRRWPCERIYEEGLGQIEITKQDRILGFAQFWQQACSFSVALQQQFA